MLIRTVLSPVLCLLLLRSQETQGTLNRELLTGKKEKRCFFHSLRACNRAPWALTSCTKKNLWYFHTQYMLQRDASLIRWISIIIFIWIDVGTRNPRHLHPRCFSFYGVLSKVFVLFKSLGDNFRLL